MRALQPGTQRWVEETTGCRVVAATALLGGVSSAVHRCQLDDGRAVVVRHIDDPAWLAREPYLVTAEAAALALVGSQGAEAELPVPEHLASDPVGGRLLMSLLPGVARIDVEHLRHTVDRFAAIAAAIARVELRDGHGLPSWRPWEPAVLEPPSWGSRSLWERAIAAYESRPPEVSRGGGVLLHRDLHPVNLLWHGPSLTGVVDWVNACVGHPHAEVYHARLNLAILVDRETADEFLDRYLHHAGADRSSGDHLGGADPYDPRWDLETPISVLDSPVSGTAWRALGRHDLTDEGIWSSVERFVAAALDAL